jgi:hypothetical protein
MRRRFYRDRSRVLRLVAGAEVPEGRRVDSEDTLAAMVRLIGVKHDADARQRQMTAQVFAGGLDAATSVLKLSRAIERAPTGSLDLAIC